MVTQRKCILDGCDDWEMSADLPDWEQYPPVIRETRQRPDIVFHSPTGRRIVMIELTVPYESRIEDAFVYKKEKYKDLAQELHRSGYDAEIWPVEIGATGFVATSAYNLFTNLSISGNKRNKALRRLSEVAERSSMYVWCR